MAGCFKQVEMSGLDDAVRGVNLRQLSARDGTAQDKSLARLAQVAQTALVIKTRMGIPPKMYHVTASERHRPAKFYGMIERRIRARRGHISQLPRLLRGRAREVRRYPNQ